MRLLFQDDWLLVGCSGVVLFLAALAFLSFYPILSLWLLALSVLTWAKPAIGMSLFFLVISVDIARPLFGGVVVSFSELELAAVVIGWIARREFSKLDRNLCRAMAPFVAVVAVSGLVNNEGYKVLPYLLRVSELSVCLVISEQVFRTSSDRRSMIWTLVAAALFYGVVGLLQIPIAFRGRVYSFFENPNQLAGYLNLLLPFFASLFLASRGRRIRLLWGYLIVGVVITAAATLSRAGMLSTLFALGCVWLFFFKNNCKGWRSEPWTSLTRFLRSSIRSFALHTGILVLLFLVLLLFSNVGEVIFRSAANVMGRSIGGIKASFLATRLPYFELGWTIWKDNMILGVGPGGYGDAIQEYRPVLDQYKGLISDYEILRSKVNAHIHNLYLQLGIEYGLLGLGTFLYIFLVLGLRLLARSEQDLPRAGLGLIAAFLVHNMFDVTFPSLAMETALLLGFSLGASTDLQANISADKEKTVVTV